MFFAVEHPTRLSSSYFYLYNIMCTEYNYYIIIIQTHRSRTSATVEAETIESHSGDTSRQLNGTANGVSRGASLFSL